MKLLLVLTNPYSSLDVLARACVNAVKGDNIDVYWLYSNMFEELVQDHYSYLEFFDVVHFIAGVESFSFDLIAKTAKYCQIVSTFHHRQFSSVPDQFKLVDHLFYVSRFLEADVKALCIPMEKTTLLHNGVDTDVFKPAYRRSENENFVIGFFGARPPNDTEDRKGTKLLLDAARQIKEQGFSPEFIIVGHGWKELVAQLRILDLTVEYFVNVGWDQLSDLYNRLNLYLITSYLEGGPLPLLEAGACATPIISTPVGLALEVLAKPGCGKLLNGFDSHEIAQAVIADLRNPDQANARALKVYLEIYKHWNWFKTYRGLSKLYKGLCTEKDSQPAQNAFNQFSETYFNFQQDPIKQRNIVRLYGMVDFAWRLYYRGDYCRAFQLAFPVFGKVKFAYFWNNFLKNIIALSPPAILFRGIKDEMRL